MSKFASNDAFVEIKLQTHGDDDTVDVISWTNLSDGLMPSAATQKCQDVQSSYPTPYK